MREDSATNKTSHCLSVLKSHRHSIFGETLLLKMNQSDVKKFKICKCVEVFQLDTKESPLGEEKFNNNPIHLYERAHTFKTSL